MPAAVVCIHFKRGAMSRNRSRGGTALVIMKSAVFSAS